MANENVKAKYGIVELNNWTERTSKAQLPLNSTDFATRAAQNGEFYFYDELAGSVKLPTARTQKLMLHYSEPKMYAVNEGLKDFALAKGTVYPRLYELKNGSTFTTNNFELSSNASYDSWAKIKAAVEAGTALYGIIQVGSDAHSGVMRIGAASDITARTVSGSNVVEGDAVVLKVVKATTMPNGENALKFEIQLRY